MEGLRLHLVNEKAFPNLTCCISRQTAMLDANRRSEIPLLAIRQCQYKQTPQLTFHSRKDRKIRSHSLEHRPLLQTPYRLYHLISIKPKLLTGRKDQRGAWQVHDVHLSFASGVLLCLFACMFEEEPHDATTQPSAPASLHRHRTSGKLPSTAARRARAWSNRNGGWG